mgnify:CR=1 FL=1
MRPVLIATIKAARIIKKKYPSIKVVILTGYPDMGESLLYENILDGVFTKPIRMQELFNQLLTLLGHRQEAELNIKQAYAGKTRAFLFTAKLLFLEPSLEVYDLLKEYFEQLARRG